jgi:hypothetical protein
MSSFFFALAQLSIAAVVPMTMQSFPHMNFTA